MLLALLRAHKTRLCSRLFFSVFAAFPLPEIQTSDKRGLEEEEKSKSFSHIETWGQEMQKKRKTGLQSASLRTSKWMDY